VLVLAVLAVPLKRAIALRFGRPTLLIWSQPASVVASRFRHPGFFSYDLSLPGMPGAPLLLGLPDGRFYQSDGPAHERGLILGNRVYFAVWFKGRRVK